MSAFDNGRFEHLFRPICVGRYNLKSRIEFSPLVSCLTGPNGEPTNELIRFVGMQAKTGAAIVTIGETAVDGDTGNAFAGELNVLTDKNIPGLALMAEEAHRYGSLMSVELCHPGRGADPSLNTVPYVLAPSAIPTAETTRHVKEMDQLEIDHLIEEYAECAERVMKADFDMVLVHCAHGNLLGAFLSPFTNKRSDWYGGSFENRIRLPLEIFKAIRSRVGDRLAIEMRISGDEMIEGGMKIDEVKDFIAIAQEYIDIVHVSRGLVMPIEKSYYCMPPYYHPHCHNVYLSEQVKNDPRIHIPVTVVGSITSAEEAEEIIASGKADLVAMARAMLADDALLRNAWAGCPEKTRPCLRCFQYCIGKTNKGKHIRCVVNPVLGRETRYSEIPFAKKRKKVVVVGGGPAGMQAVQTLIERGHDVTLIEKNDRIGGKLHKISCLPFKQDMRRYLKWAVDTTMNSGAKILLNTEATPEAVRAEKPDAILLAMGSDPLVLPIPGRDADNVYPVIEVDTGKAEVGKRVVICGGGLSGCECGLALAQEGHEVTIVDMIPVDQFAKDMVVITRRMLLDLLAQNHVRLLGDRKVLAFSEKGVEVEDKNWRHEILEADTVVEAFGMRKNDALVEKLKRIVPETYVIGDCGGVADIGNAVHTAFNYAVEI